MFENYLQQESVEMNRWAKLGCRFGDKCDTEWWIVDAHLSFSNRWHPIINFFLAMQAKLGNKCFLLTQANY